MSELGTSEELSINPFYRKIEDSDARLMSDEGSKTLAVFAVAHELALLRKTIEETNKQLKKMDSVSRQQRRKP